MAIVELDFSEKNPINKKFGAGVRHAYRFEQSFGFGGKNPVTVDLGEETGNLRLHGYIDRIDRQDNRTIIMDYKSGSTRIPVSDMREGRNFQMMVYLLAAEQILGDDMDVVGGLFWHISGRHVSGDIQLDDEHGQEALDEAKTHIVNYLKQARTGNFAVQPKSLDNGKCVRYCEFYQLCRVSNTNLFKQQHDDNL